MASAPAGQGVHQVVIVVHPEALQLGEDVVRLEGLQVPDLHVWGRRKRRRRMRSWKSRRRSWSMNRRRSRGRRRRRRSTREPDCLEDGKVEGGELWEGLGGPAGVPRHILHDQPGRQGRI